MDESNKKQFRLLKKNTPNNAGTDSNKEEEEEVTSNKKETVVTPQSSRRAGGKSYFDQRYEDIAKKQAALEKKEGENKVASKQRLDVARKNLREVKDTGFLISAAGPQDDSISWVGNKFVDPVNGYYKLKPSFQKAVSLYVAGETDKIPDKFLEYIQDVDQEPLTSERDLAVKEQIDKYRGTGKFAPLEKAVAQSKAESSAANRTYREEQSKIAREQEHVAKEKAGRTAEITSLYEFPKDRDHSVPLFAEDIITPQAVNGAYFVRVNRNFDEGPNVNYIVKPGKSKAGLPVMNMYPAAKRYTDEVAEKIAKGITHKIGNVSLDDLRLMSNAIEGTKDPVAVFDMKDWQSKARAYAEGNLQSADKQKTIRSGSGSKQVSSRQNVRDYDNIFKKIESGKGTLEDIMEAFPKKWADKDTLMSFIDSMGGAVGSDGKVYSSKELISLANRGKTEGDQITEVKPAFRTVPMPVNVNNDRVTQDDEYIWNKYFMDKNIVDVQPDDAEENGYWDIEEKAKFVKKMLRANQHVIIDADGNIKQDHDHEYLNWTEQYQYKTPNAEFGALNRSMLGVGDDYKYDEETGMMKKVLKPSNTTPYRNLSGEEKQEYANNVNRKLEEQRTKNAESLERGIKGQFKAYTGEEATPAEIANQMSRDIRIKGINVPEKDLNESLSLLGTPKARLHNLAVKVTDKFIKLMNDRGTGIKETLDAILKSDPTGESNFVQGLWKLTDELAEVHGKTITEYTELNAIAELLAIADRNKAKAAEEYRTKYQPTNAVPLGRLAKFVSGRTN